MSAFIAYFHEMIDHDRLFKELISTFFLEFIELFFPEVSPYVESNSFAFLDKEVFTDVTSGDRHEADLVVKARFRNTEVFFLFLVEHQGRPEGEFGRRLFRYFARLYEKFGLPVYPIVIFSYDQPKRAESTTHRVEFPNKVVLEFNYDVIQLNRYKLARLLATGKSSSKRFNGEDGDENRRTPSRKTGMSETACDIET
jgi:hypothetical protein